MAQHDDPVGEVEDLLEVVGDEQDAGTGVAELGDRAAAPAASRRRRATRSARRARAGAGAGSSARPRATSCFWPRERARAVRSRGSALGTDPLEDAGGVVTAVALGEQQPVLAAEHDVGGDVEVVADAVVLPQHLDARPAHELSASEASERRRTRSSPASGSMMRAMHDTSDDLPAPVSPTRATTSPRRTWR